MSENYHREELRIALAPDDPRHILPPAVASHQKILDIGCGAGQTLIAAYPGRVSYGIDVDLGALKLGKSLTSHVCFVCGKAEALPWPNEEFDIVVARVSLVYSDMLASLKEVHRVLKKGGILWMTLHPFSMAWNGSKSRSLKSWIYLAYVVLNSVLFHYTQKQFALLGRYESFQTERGMLKALRRTGFEDIDIQRGRHFLITAKSG